MACDTFFLSFFSSFYHHLFFPFQNYCQRLPLLVCPTLITCLMTRVGIAHKLQGVASSVAKLGVVTPINNSLVSLLQFPSYMNESVNISLQLCCLYTAPLSSKVNSVIQDITPYRNPFAEPTCDFTFLARNSYLKFCLFIFYKLNVKQSERFSLGSLQWPRHTNY